MELARLRKELAEIKLERDLLKKCVAYFAKDSRGNTNGSNNCDISLNRPFQKSIVARFAT